MNQEEILKTIEEEMMYVIQNVDEMVDEKFQSGEISTEQYLSLSQRIRAYADEGRNILSILRTHSGAMVFLV